MIAIFFIISGILLRLVPHVPNFAPITAIAMFSGVYLNKKVAIFIPVLTMAISDYLLGSFLHSTTPYVWGSFMVSGLIGLYLRKRKSAKNIIVASLLASLQFFLITNFGVWATGMYNRSISGLIESYIMGIPFYRWTLLGDLFYTAAFFSLYEFVYFKLNNYKAGHHLLK